MTSLGSASTVWNSDLNEFISEDHRRFAEIIGDLFPTYSLVYIPKNERITENDRLKPWAILDTPKNMPAYIVRYMSEVEMNDPKAMLAWLMAGDLTRNKPGDVLRRIEAEENAAQLLAMKREEDSLQDRIEHVAFLTSGGRDKKHTLQLGGGRTMERR